MGLCIKNVHNYSGTIEWLICLKRCQALPVSETDESQVTLEEIRPFILARERKYQTLQSK